MSRRWGEADRAAAVSIQRLSSGHRVTTPADDAAGLSISERLRGQTSGALQAQRNVTDAISLIRTGDAVLGKIAEILQRTRELAARHEHGGLPDSDRSALRDEAAGLGEAVRRLGAATRFNGVQLLDGTSAGLTIHVGGAVSEDLTLTLPSLDALVDADAFDFTRTESSIARVDQAIELVAAARESLGDYENRLEFVATKLVVEAEQTIAADSRIRDADMATEMTGFVRERITSQATRAVAAHARIDARSVLRLLHA